MNVGKILSGLMKEQKLTSAELARLTGIVQPVIYRMAAGETDNPKIGTLIPIANYFGISINQLIGLNEPSQNVFSSIGEKNNKIPLLKWNEISEFPAIGEEHEYVSIDEKRSGSCFAVKIDGPTMNPAFPDNCIAVFDSSLTAKHGDYILVSFKEQSKITLKQFLVDGEDLYLKPLNQDLKTVFINELSTIIIKGILIETRIKFRE